MRARGVQLLWIALVAVLTLSGLLLRLNRIGAESIDLEEYACIGSLGAPGFTAFVAEQRQLYPYGAPFVPALFYFWSRIAGTDIVAIRLFVVLFGTALIPAVYLAGRAFTGSRWAALTAAACTALSPAFIYQGQEARMYAFLALGAALSFLSLAHMQTAPDSRWRWLHYAANVVVIWSHLFGVMLVAVQGLWLLWVWRGHWKALFRWALVHAVILLPVALWTLGLAEAGSTLHGYYHPPGMRQLMDDLLKDDVVHGSTVAWWPAPPERSPWGTWHVTLQTLRAFTDPMMQGLFAAALAWWLWRLPRQRADREALRRNVLLLFWALGPLAIIFALSHLWQPVYSSRYSGYGALAQYIMLGAMLAALPFRALRAAALAALVALYAHQLAMSLPGPMRTEWREVLHQIAGESTPDAPVFVEDPFWLQVININRHEDTRVIEGAYERATLCDIAAIVAGETGEAWVLLVDLKGEGPDAVRECLAARGMRVSVSRHYGERTAYLVKAASAASGVTPCTPGLAMRQLMARQGNPETAATLEEIQQRVRYEPDARAGAYLRAGIALLKAGHTNAACRILQRAEEVLPALSTEGLTAEGPLP
jgi:4-amino-4-deoxy-L-arabinose transferase-like glycosyltransferase